MAFMEIFLDTFAAICEYLKEFLSRAVKSLEEVSTNLREGFAEPS